MVLLQYEEESKEVCILMSWLGYGPEIRQKRRICYSEYARLVLSLINLREGFCIVAGSKSEGLTCMLENDLDLLFVVSSVICLEDCLHIRDLPDDTVAFMMDNKYTYPGYYRLLLLHREGIDEITVPLYIEHALCDDGRGNFFLSSDLFADSVRGINRSGPATRAVYGPLHSDYVFTIRCHSTVLLEKWAERSRYWPPLEVVKKVITFGACLTPVGFKESPYRHMEWRMCFNTGETEMMNSLSDTQLKIYVMLKMIVKDVLRPQHKEVTSYTLKNIILWQAESYPQSLFSERNFFYWLREGLGTLKIAIATKYLKYYMIPERNLMEGCGLRHNQQSKWTSVITEMMNEGPRIILRLHKIRKAVIAFPEPLMWYSKMRTELEMLMLECVVRQILLLSENDVVIDRKNMVSVLLSKCLVEPDSINGELWARVMEIVRTIALNLNVSNVDLCMISQIFCRMLS
ncbi:hypothetical protein DPMN_125610 [Dreissena polymorpha]|uniref:Mab-21-like HhH/H2TH-like domain-containing protein n=1 Tax=Dreissena polymorpha TaxID=45954 RepID=A0A9D4JXC7_DREPO|nr:hypothetical protein DPMN_125610 [Dreissena polymorpha]